MCESFEELLAKAEEMLDIQGSNGNWNYDPYMHGMYNGMALIVSIFKGIEPDFKDAPDEFMYEINSPEMNKLSVSVSKDSCVKF